MLVTSPNEKRERIRIPADARVVLHTENKALSLDGVTRDISMKGLFAKIDAGFPPGTKCQVEIVLSGKSSELSIKLTGTIVRQDTTGCGVHFESDLEWWPVFAMHLPRDKKVWKLFEEELPESE